MAQNDFLPVATGGGANVESQASYAADPVVPVGFGVNAIPPSSLWNKMMRQSSTIAAMLAAFLATSAGIPMVDDGNAASKLAAMNAAFRIKLQANQTFYVNGSTGNDANPGTIASPWATLQHAADVIAYNYDLGAFSVVIDITGSVGPLSWYSRPAGNNLNGSTPNITISTSTAAAIAGGASNAILLESVYVKLAGAITLTSTGANCIDVASYAFCNIGAGVIFGACANGSHVLADLGQAVFTGNYSVTGGAKQHYLPAHQGLINFANGVVCTLTGTPAFSVAFANCTECSGLDVNAGSPVTYVGSATGPRYFVDINAYIIGTAAAASFFPGNSSGSTSRGGQYG